MPVDRSESLANGEDVSAVDECVEIVTTVSQPVATAVIHETGK